MLTHVACEALAAAVAGKGSGICGGRCFPLLVIDGENGEFNPALTGELLFRPGENFLNKLLVGCVGYSFVAVGIV